MKIRKFIRFLHRDFGYLFFGMTIVYALSGISLNHIHDWNPSYIITNKNIKLNEVVSKESINSEYISSVLELLGEDKSFKKFYFPKDDEVKVFLDGGSLIFNINTGEGNIEKIKKRPIFNQLNVLHYNNPRKYWTIISDIFASALIILAVTGLFMVRGKKGIKGRGAWITAIGIIIPLIFIFLFA